MNAKMGFTVVVMLIVTGCSGDGLQPVELYPEDECANCRMTVSDPKFASEIIARSGEVMKFDDLACLDEFRRNHPGTEIAAMFVKDFETAQWLPYERSVIVQTGVETPMGSGKVAVAGSERAAAVQEQFPASDRQCTDGCCGS